MLTNPDNNQVDLPCSLLSELERFIMLIRDHTPEKSAPEKALALVRVVHSLDTQDWERFAALHDLKNWLAIPLDKDLASSVSNFFRILERLTFQRDHDALTGLANRRLFEHRLELEIERSLRSDNELSLLMLDLDDFKRVNDTFGHPCGDLVLQRVGALLSSSTRPYDLAARLGGEEFALLFPSTSCWTGAMLGHRILEQLSFEIFECESGNFSITFSAGVSSISLLKGVVTSEKLITSADQALYTAKRGGKNKVLVAESEKRSKDRASLVHSDEKLLLFSSNGTEYDQ